jgi:phytoene synthase
MPQPGDKSDLAAAAKLLRNGSHSFFAASLLLPPRISKPAMALYAFCRVADDEIDLGTNRPAALASLTARLDDIYRGTPAPNPVDRVFAATVAAHHIPHSLPAALVEGLAWDAEGRRYENFNALLDYAARVAGAVGVMMAQVMGVRDAATLARAADLGMAMQLTNIARDVGEDARAGRLYLPLDWLAEAGINPDAFLQNPDFTPAIATLVRRLLSHADALYASGAEGIAKLPWDCRTGIAAAARIYAAIGRKIAACGHDSINRRAYVSTPRKLTLAIRAVTDVFSIGRAISQSMLPQIEFLVAAATPLPILITPPAPSGFDKLLNLFERLERAQREGELA